MKKLNLIIVLVLTAGLTSGFVFPSQVVVDQVEASQIAPLSSAEVAGLVFMREEEKLAHDLYAAFYEIYGLQAFQNIAASELTHASAIQSLLGLYAISDPAGNTPAGVFVDPALQALYDQLLAQGERSLAEAIKAAAAVEEIDILDLQARLDQTAMLDIVQVYKNLEAGSENHLRAFVSLLKVQTNEVYQPGYLSAEEYQRILSGTAGNGNRGRQGNKGPGGPRPQ